jgi:peptide/nickel transport system substrate-binding protein/oligopeptide transport system substrate-binding protein
MLRLPALPIRFWPLALGLALGACAKESEQAVRVAVLDEGQATLDSATARILLRSATSEGLIALDGEGKVVPAIAERWIVADDGQSYIFRLRDSTWPDGTRLSGESVAAALRQALANLRGTGLALDLAVVADVRAMAGRVVEIRLRRPMPDFLQLLAQPELGLTRRREGAGPMALKHQEALAWLTPIAPDKRGQPLPDDWQQAVRPLALVSRNTARALAEAGAGKVDIVLGGTFANVGLVKLRAMSKMQLRFDPVSGLFGLVVLRAEGLLATPRNREALAMAIDRAALASQIGAPNWVATTRIIAPGLEGDTGRNGERWTDYDLEGRRTLAGRRIADWVAASKASAKIRVALPQGAGADRLAARLTEDFATIGVAVERVAFEAPADLRLIDSVAPYPAPAWFFNQLNCAIRQPCAPQADALAAKAQEADPAQAPTFMAEAEREYAKANLYIPLGMPLRWSLAPANYPGFSTNRWGFHPLFPLANRRR